MTGIHWADDHSRFVRDRFPELGGEAVYIRLKSEVTINTCIDEARAFTGLSLDLALREELTSRGEWRGRGFTCVICEAEEFFHASWPEQVGLVLHELAHHLADRQTVLDETEESAPGGPQIETACYRDSAGEWLDWCMRGEHGPEFVRAGLHTFWRGRHDVPLYAMNIFWDRYGSPDAEETIEALHSELELGGNIVDLMRSPMPETFAKLWT